MSKRLKVLMSAYACEPGRGSEPEVGWQWAAHMARFHDVTVVTRANNKSSIEAAMASASGPQPRFVYHDLGRVALAIKRMSRLTRLYYAWWQQSARKLVSRMCQQQHFDVLHHVTFASFRYNTALHGHGVPTVWGPVGGAESTPTALLPWRHPRSLIPELFRNAENKFSPGRISRLSSQFEKFDHLLASTIETKELLERAGAHAHLMPAIGLPAHSVEPRRVEPPVGPLKLLFVGNLQALKGVDLAIQALKVSTTDSRLTLIGDGPFLSHLRRLTEKLGLHDKVSFVGRLPRREVMQSYPGHHVLIFPSLHDSGGYAVIEAMLHQLPAIAIGIGGPRMAIESGKTGFLVEAGSRAEVVEALANVIRHYSHQRELIVQHGIAARESVIRKYNWEAKASQMDAIYRQLALAQGDHD